MDHVESDHHGTISPKDSKRGSGLDSEGVSSKLPIMILPLQVRTVETRY